MKINGTLMSKIAKDKSIKLNSEKFYSGVEQFYNNIKEISEEAREIRMSLSLLVIWLAIKKTKTIYFYSDGTVLEMQMKFIQKKKKELKTGNNIKG